MVRFQDLADLSKRVVLGEVDRVELEFVVCCLHVGSVQGGQIGDGATSTTGRSHEAVLVGEGEANLHWKPIFQCQVSRGLGRPRIGSRAKVR